MIRKVSISHTRTEKSQTRSWWEL